MEEDNRKGENAEELYLKSSENNLNASESTAERSSCTLKHCDDNLGNVVNKLNTNDNQTEEGTVASVHSPPQPTEHERAKKKNESKAGLVNSESSHVAGRSGKNCDDQNGNDDSGKDDKTHLEAYGVRTFNMKLQAFAQEVCKDDDEPFDLVITEPPTAPSRSFIR